jgi:3-hydroxyisobutyrate dehydrogenase-like beta-hydroxyacid dehydrogenase
MQLGYVGLGAMGAEVVKRLLAAGYPVSGYNRTRAKAAPLLDLGMELAESPRIAAERSDVVFTMVTDNAALRAVTEGPDGILAGLGEGKVYVDMSTASPTVSRELAGHVARLGASMLDAPISGTALTVQQGTASLMVGGDAHVVELIRPVLEAVGPKVTHVGDNGQAVLMKIATNLSLAVQMLAFSEGVLLAEKGGIPREVAVDVLLGSVIASPMVKYRGPFVLGLPEEAWFNVDMMQKDLLLALEQGRRLEVPLPTTAATNELLTTARAMGFAAEDFAVVFRALARMAEPE